MLAPSLPRFLIFSAFSAVSFQLKRLNYIGPIRRGPRSIASIEAS